ncbi:hypothetical protein [Chryseobacterium sp.]|uniref:hypothetical protein n=1 Tax=Chryseobacterium sp. TaxID=1871047 RepID=UPI0025C2FF60|nr:hypothetical protein [Chryseobacterium sp.]
MKKYIIALIAIMLSVDTYSQVGINTSAPTAMLDVNGDIRVRDIPESTSTNDISLVADASGVIKKRIGETKGIMRGYITSDFSMPATLGPIYTIPNWLEIDDPHNDFDPSTNIFTAPETGLYRITITATFSYPTGAGVTTNYVIGLARKEGTNNTWVMRFSIPQSSLNASEMVGAGYAHTFTGLAQLEAGKQYIYGLSGGITLLANPTGNTGTGIGSYFSIQLIKN